jgi:hypothetical protein
MSSAQSLNPIETIDRTTGALAGVIRIAKHAHRITDGYHRESIVPATSIDYVFQGFGAVSRRSVAGNQNRPDFQAFGTDLRVGRTVPKAQVLKLNEAKIENGRVIRQVSFDDTTQGVDGPSHIMIRHYDHGRLSIQACPDALSQFLPSLGAT